MFGGSGAAPVAVAPDEAILDQVDAPAIEPWALGAEDSGILAPMSRLRLTTAGESHGLGLFATLRGLPAGLRVDFDELRRVMDLVGQNVQVRAE